MKTMTRSEAYQIAKKSNPSLTMVEWAANDGKKITLPTVSEWEQKHGITSHLDKYDESGETDEYEDSESNQK